MRGIFLIVWVLLFIGVPVVKANPYAKAKKKIVVIDAGHGGKDTGAIGKNSREKDIVLAISLKVGALIEAHLPQVDVIYTRKTDVFIPLHERAEIANKNKADLFLSIHANSNRNTKPFGTETFSVGLHKTQGNLEVAKKENSVIVYEEDYSTTYQGFDPNSAESYIIFSLMQNTFSNQSISLASFIQDEFKIKAKRKDRGVKQAGFLVLWHTSMPSVLIETGFISNLEEEKYLMSKQGQNHLAQSIYTAVEKYFKDVDPEMFQKKTEQVSKEQEVNVEMPKLNNGLVYRVQVASSTNKIASLNDLYSGDEEVYEFSEKDMYKYAIGAFDSYENVKGFQKKIKKQFPDSFIVAFLNNKKIPLREALNINK